jgi:hypothetical protein
MSGIIPFIPLIASGVSAVGGYLANKGKTTQATAQAAAPTFDPASAGLRGQVANIIAGRLNDNSLPAGYETGGIQNINKSYDAVNAKIASDLTARGLNSSPVAGTVTARSDLARAGDIGGFRTQLPLMARQLQNQDIGLADQFANLGRGTTSTGSSTGETATGGGAAGAFTNLAQMLGYLTGKGSFSNMLQPGLPKAPLIPSTASTWQSLIPQAAGPMENW